MNMKFTLSMLFCAGILSNAAMAQQPRLLQRAFFSNNGAFVFGDSSDYFYTGTNGQTPGNFAIPEFEMMYDSMHVYSSPTNLSMRTTRTFDGSKNVTEQQTDTMTSSGWRGKELVTITYKSGKPDSALTERWSSFGGGGWRNSSLIVYNTFSGKYPTSLTAWSWSMGGGGNWRSNYKQSITYNGSGQITNLEEQDYYSHLSGFRNVSRISITYNGTKPSTENLYTWDTTNNSWLVTNRATYTFNTDGTVKEREDQFYFQGTWYNSALYQYTYSNPSFGKNPDSMIHLEWSAISSPQQYLNKRLYTYTWNGANQILTMDTKGWDAGTSTWKATFGDSIVHNYYESFWPVSINNTNIANYNSVKVYPNPANDLLNIDMPRQGTATHFTIYSVNGQVAKEWDNETKVSVSDLTSGVYFLNVSNGQMVTTKRFVISR